MALQGLASTFIVTTPPRPSILLPSTLSKFPAPTTRLHQCVNAKATKSTVYDNHLRRNAKYPPSFWDDTFINSLSNNFTEEKYMNEVAELNDQVKHMIQSEIYVPLAKLEFLDSVQRLGLKYLFEKDIEKAVDDIYDNTNAEWLSHDLYSTTLRFRILRQRGYFISQDVFRKFRDETCNIRASLCEDVKGLLSLYEASFFGLEGEDVMNDVRVITTTHLKNVLEGNVNIDMDSNMLRKVKHALDMPLHWKVPRLEARWYIDTYEQEPNMNLSLLKLAKLNYNIVQSVHQQEVSKLARWWTDIGLNKLSFARDRWDITDIDKLPMNIKMVLLALFNTTNEIGYWTLRERDFNIIPHLSKQWANLCKAYLKEAKWYHSGYKPTLDEYLENAVVSIAAPIILFCAYFLTTEKITVKASDHIHKLPSIMQSTSMILRLTKDLGTSSDELAQGDNMNAIQCYMNDTGASEEMARKYVDDLVHNTWNILNKDVLQSYLFRDEPFLVANPNLARTSQCFYLYGDGHGVLDSWTKDYLIPLLIEPLTIS